MAVAFNAISAIWKSLNVSLHKRRYDLADQVFGIESLHLMILCHISKTNLVQLELVNSSWKQVIRNTPQLWANLDWSHLQELSNPTSAIVKMIKHAGYKTEYMDLRGCDVFWFSLGHIFATIPSCSRLKCVELGDINFQMILEFNKCKEEGNLHPEFHVQAASIVLKLRSSVEDISAFIDEASVGCVTFSGIYLDYNVLDDRRFQDFTMKMARNKIIKTLSLSGECLKDEYMQHLAFIIQANTALTEIEISAFDSFQTNMSLLEEALIANNTLRILRLNGLKMNEDSMCSLARALEENSALEEFEIGRDRISYSCACHLAAALKRNSHLKVMKIAGINKGGVSRREQAERRPIVRIESRPMNDSEGVNALLDVVKGNNQGPCANSTMQEIQIGGTKYLRSSGFSHEI